MAEGYLLRQSPFTPLIHDFQLLTLLSQQHPPPLDARPHEVQRGTLAGARRAMSEQASLGQRHAHAVAHDDVVEQANVDQGKRFLHALRDELVRVTGFGDAGRMIVRDDDRSGIALQRQFDDLTRMDACALRLAFSECL